MITIAPQTGELICVDCFTIYIVLNVIVAPQMSGPLAIYDRLGSFETPAAGKNLRNYTILPIKYKFKQYFNIIYNV